MSSLWVKPAYNSARGPAVYASLKNGIHTTCVLDADKYIDLCADWFDAWLQGDSDAMARFKSGGALSGNGEWTDYASKGLSGNLLAGSVFTGGRIWPALALLELVVIAVCIALLRRKGRAKTE